MTTVAIKIVGDDQVVAYLAALPSSLARMILEKFQQKATETSQHIKADLLSGQLLGVKTGRLRSSIVGRVYASKGRVTINIQSRGDVPYAGIYEKGGEIRSHVIRAKGRGLSFVGKRDGKRILVPEVELPAIAVRGRHYLEQGVADKMPSLIEAIGEAIYDARAL